MRIGRAVALSAAAAGLAAIYNRAAADAAEQRHTPRGRFVEIDGVRLHLVDRGRGEAVLYLHGNGAMVEEMQATGLLELLSRDRRVIAVDRPGFGHSSRPPEETWTPERQADLMVGLLDSLGITSAILLAHSTGALTAMALAIHHPQRVRGIVAVCGFFYPEARFDQMFSALAVPAIGDALRHTIAPLASRLAAPLVIAHLFAPNEPTREFEQLYPVSLATRPSQLRALGEEYGFVSPAADRLSRHYGRVACPVVVLVGSEDRVLDPKHHSIGAAEAIAGAELRMIDGVGHMLTHIEQFAVARAVADVGRRAAEQRERTAIGAGAGSAA